MTRDLYIGLRGVISAMLDRAMANGVNATKVEE